MSLQIKKATRQGVKPLIVLYSESGCGKTFSALLLARGFVGPTGKMVMVDTESGRGSLYADVPEFGGYDVIELESPFTPARYIEAIDAVEQSGATIGIFDSGSHEWEGAGGVLDMSVECERRSGKQGLHNWREPKLEHAKFVQRLLRSKIPWIVCLRAKFKTRQGKDPNSGKTIIIKDDYTSPIQAEDFIFESTCHAEILPKHNINLTKHSHPELKKCFPTQEEGPLTIKHGQMIAAWCNGAAKAAAGPQMSTLKKELWEVTKAKHGGDKAALQQWLVDECILDPDVQLDSLTELNLSSVIKKAKAKLQ